MQRWRHRCRAEISKLLVAGQNGQLDWWEAESWAGAYNSWRLLNTSVTTYGESQHPPPAGVEAAVPESTRPSRRRGNSLPVLRLCLKTCRSFSLCGHQKAVLNVLPTKYMHFCKTKQTVSYHGKSQSTEKMGCSPPTVCCKTSFAASNYSLLMKVREIRWTVNSDFANRDINNMQITFFLKKSEHLFKISICFSSSMKQNETQEKNMQKHVLRAPCGR